MVTARLPGALVGRERELALLEASLDTAQSGRPGITLVVGEAGIGKTRLVDEGAVIARAAGMRVLRGEADRTWREPMELWRGVHRSLGIEPFRDLTVPAEVRRWDHPPRIAGRDFPDLRAGVGRPRRMPLPAAAVGRTVVASGHHR